MKVVFGSCESREAARASLCSVTSNTTASAGLVSCDWSAEDSTLKPLALRAAFRLSRSNADASTATRFILRPVTRAKVGVPREPVSSSVKSHLSEAVPNDVDLDGQAGRCRASVPAWPPVQGKPLLGKPLAHLFSETGYVGCNQHRNHDEQHDEPLPKVQAEHAVSNTTPEPGRAQ